MSGPFRFNQQQQDSRSPLDRPAPNLFPAGQPPSFKTNVNRSKTKKWVEAKPYSYDGDDWGDVDEYDEYGADEPQAPPQPAAVTGLRQPASRFEDSSRSFTDPQHQGFPQPARRNSFEAGEEHRAFSAGTYPPQKPYDEPSHGAPSQSASQVHPALRQASAAESDTSDTPQHRRDFNPAALPPPLMTKVSPAPGSATGSPLNPKYPIRKSSIGQMDSPVAITPRDRAPSNPTKPLPFVRPADIYKRVEEERQRERTASMDSSRPNLDSLTPQPKEGATSPQSADTFGKSADPATSLHPLETVDERKSEYLPPSLPQADDSDAPAGSDDQGLRSAVNQAFTRTDDSRSVPPTPISKSDSGVSRSNTDSTSGISPIMSRVPSSGTSALKTRNAAGDGSTPMIAEEASESSTPAVSRPTSSATMLGNAHQITRKPSPTSHTRDLSGSSLPRSGLTTPSRGESPARSPAVEPQTYVPASESALYSSLSPTSPEAMNAGFGQPVSTYATREADIASALKLSPTKAAPELGAAEKESQDAFLASHQTPDSPLSDTDSRSRSESPSKGRVQELAGKFGDVSNPRRGSTQSNASGNSLQSWERSPDHSRPSSPTKASTSRPISPAKHILGLSERPAATRAEPSFRPKLPGTWESYATTQPTPSDQGDRDMQLSGSGRMTPEGQQVSSSHSEVDLTPTTAKHPVLTSDPSKSPTSPSDALAALKAAGAAIGTSLQESVGLGSSSQGRTYGDVHISRPLYADRTLTTDSTNSSIPPTPPVKDSPEFEDLPPPPPLKEKSPGPFASSSHEQTPVRPTVIPQLSTDISVNDLESDRLRKEIVASLTPLTTSETPSDGPSLQPTSALAANRASSILPSEYDSYWADGDQASPRPSNDLTRNVSEHPQTSANQSPVGARSTATELSAAAKPPVSNQHFSWEGGQSNPILLEGQAQLGADAQASRDLQEEKEVASSTTSNAIDKESTSSFRNAPDTYFGPSHVAAIVKPDTVDESDITARLPTPPPKSEHPLSPTRADTVREALHPTGLHVVNTKLDPEAVDMPPRLSAQISPVSQQSVANPEDAAVSREPHIYQQPTFTAPVAGPTMGSSAYDRTPKSPTSPSDKPKGFREIVTIKSPSERIATYNQTREYWAKTDHGLNDWIASAVATNPGLESATVLQHRPTVAATTTSRHKATGSLSIFGKKEGSSNAQVPAAPYYEQYNSAAANMPSTPTSSGGADPAEVRPQNFNAGQSGGRSASHQMQTKGKDLLHKAELLGGKGLGKGMTSAKGLFAKGKSRFGKSGNSDKASQPNSLSSSREASEEPEFISTTATATTTPEKPLRIMSMSIESSTPKEEKKKRRMSSPFHRSSRSRSRPPSIVLPKNAHFDFPSSTPESTPPRETPPLGHSREQFFHAPNSWGVTSDPGSNQRDVSGSLSTSSRSGSLQPPERLGVLPSPAKSAFNFLRLGDDEDIPPVPPLPDGLQERPSGRESQESARHRQSEESARQHRLIHSIVRYSTPPAMDLEVDEGMFKDASAPSPVLQASPTFREPADAQGDAEVDTRSQHDGWKMRLLKQMETDGLPSQANTSKGPPRSAPGPDEMVEDRNSLPPQLNNNTHTSRTVPGYVKAEEDDDDLPPNLSYEPPQPFYRAPDISPLGSLSSSVPRTKRLGNDERLPPQLKNSTLQPRVMSELGQTSEDEDDLPPQLNYEPPQPTDLSHPAGLGASILVSTHYEEDDDDLPPLIIHEPPQPIHRTLDPSPPAGPVDHFGEISPVASSVGIAHTDESDDEVHSPPNLGLRGLMLKSQYRKGDVSPMISVKKTRDDPQPRDASSNEVSAARVGYESQKIGVGDISPVSLHTQDDDDATPAVAKGDQLLMTPHSRQTAKLTVLEVDQGLSAPLENALAPNTNVAQPPKQHHHISTSPYQILHAVQYFPSSSSLDSIEFSEHESNIAPSQGDRYEEIPPVPPIHPSDMVQLEDDQTPLQRYPESRQPTFDLSKSPSSDKIHPLISGPAQQDSHSMHKAETATSGNHKRTQSLLSAISSMVPGDGVSISSAASSQAGGSRPASAARHLQGSPAKTSPIPTLILEESGRLEQDTMAVPITDDYDLYSDQNGVVKDAPIPPREVARPAQKAKLGAARMVAIPKPAREEDTRRYSDERPMSFVSGPRDSHGRPQEEILSTRSGNIPPVPRIPNHQLQGQTQARPNETIYISPPPPQSAPKPYEEFYQPGPAPVQLVRRETVSPLHSSLHSERLRTPPHSNVSPPPPSNASPPPQPSPPPVLAERPLLDAIRMQTPIQIPPLQDPRLASPSMQDPRYQGPPMQDQRYQGPPMQDQRYQSPPMQDPRFQSPPMQDPRFQSPPVQDPRFKSPPMQDSRFKSPPTQDPNFQSPSPDPRLQNLPARDFSMRDPRSPLDSAPRTNGIDVIPPIPQDPRVHQAQKPKQTYNTPSRMGMPRLGGAGPPRNQYELQQQQQQMQHQVVDPRQTIDPRLRNAEHQLSGVAPAQINGQPPKQEEKVSSRPKFASVLKGLAGKASSSTPQAAQQPPTRIDPSLQVPAASIRRASYHPNVNDLPEESVPAKKEGRTGALGSLSGRPKSVGTESHISQDSTRVQAAESRLDLRHPVSPAPFKGIPPPQMPQGAPQPSQQQYQAQSQAPNGAPQHFQQPQAQRISIPDSGKKKRFSSLGNLFRTPGQTKLSKEEKKMQKTQKHSSAMPQFQSPPPSQHYNPQQPQQYQVQYGPPPAATRPFPGMSPASTMSPTTSMPPTSPQRGEYQGMPPQNMQPQGYQQPPYQYQQHPQQNVQQNMPQNAPQHMPQNTSQNMPQNAPQNVPQHVPQQVQYGPNGSIFPATKPIATQTLQSPRPVPQTSRSVEDPRPSMQAPTPSLEHPMQRAETTNQPPVAGYYKPDSKRADGEPQNHAPPFIAFEQHQQHLQRQQQALAPPQPVNQRSVSSPVSSPPPNHVPQAVQPNLQRRISFPPGEPQYDTPPIPGAYNPVKGVFTLPSPHSSAQFAQTATSESNQYRGPPPSAQSSAQFTQPVYTTRSEPTQYQGGPPNTQSPVHHPPPAQAMQAARPEPSPERQYSDPNMQPISPQISAVGLNGSAQGQQGSDPNMPPISPQVSAQQGTASARQYSDVSILDQNDSRNPSDPSMRTISPMISNEQGPSPGMPSVTPVSNQKPQKARMSSITEAAQQERPWNLNVREGATEQEIVRARHHQFMLAQIAAQQEAHAAARIGGSPSPRPSQQSRSPSPRSQERQQSPQPPISAAQFAGGFREVLPKSSPLPMAQSYNQPASNYVTRSQQHSPAPSASPHQRQANLHPDQAAQPAAYPLPVSPASAGARSPVNPVANSLAPPPPPNVPRSPMRPESNTTQFQAPPHQHQHQQYRSPYPEEEEREVDYEKQPPQHEQHLQQPDYEQPPPDEPPPSYNSYSGPDIPHESMEKDRSRPPNISTEAANHGRQTRQRQPSIGLLQHPQPASMAASPQRSSADMGADTLRLQLLQQEERARTERLHRAEIQRAETERERAERERARARARELERSVSGGTRVGSLRSVAGSGRVPGWERRGSSSRPVFELPAVEDDEPVMRATSFPGQEWVPTFTED